MIVEKLTVAAVNLKWYWLEIFKDKHSKDKAFSWIIGAVLVVYLTVNRKKPNLFFVVGRSRMFEDIRRELIMKYSVFNHSDRSNRSDRGFNRRFVGYWSITGRRSPVWVR